MRYLFLVLAFLSIMVLGLETLEAEVAVRYNDEFPDHYLVRGVTYDLTEPKYKTSPVRIVPNPGGRVKAVIRRTKATAYPYGDQKCVIRFKGKDIDDRRDLQITDFRTVELSWINRKLVFIKINVGHIAGVHAIYDVRKDSWIYREWVTYIKDILRRQRRQSEDSRDSE